MHDNFVTGGQLGIEIGGKPPKRQSATQPFFVSLRNTPLIIYQQFSETSWQLYKHIFGVHHIFSTCLPCAAYLIFFNRTATILLVDDMF